ncbi:MULTISPECIES: hypothetical protein [unclassified Leifsonia]|uniref:hypothetical protein n=1 Tax=unclassified Leifsonia TaxID=2663824 RepID=UPI0008A7E341|nr:MULTISPECIES: hypothetical protein [unclassified Leifsonia]SEI09992.1 hypothetical protein SAMN04515694_11541 [Leifsonia sp. CL154]SFL86901.1 hypothetical protein SAMN04515692_11567 [Leifsonia sp. CL147]
MLGFVIFLVAFAVIFGIMWLIRKGTNAAWKQANQKVLFRGSHQEGQTLVSTAVNIDTAAAAADVTRAVRTGVDLPDGVQSAVIGQLYIETATDDTVSFVMGSKVGTSFRSVLHLEPNGDRTRGVYTITNWTESDGIVSNIKEMQFIERRIRESILALDAGVAFATSTSARA